MYDRYNRRRAALDEYSNLEDEENVALREGWSESEIFRRVRTGELKKKLTKTKNN